MACDDMMRLLVVVLENFYWKPDRYFEKWRLLSHNNNCKVQYWSEQRGSSSLLIWSNKILWNLVRVKSLGLGLDSNPLLSFEALEPPILSEGPQNWVQFLYHSDKEWIQGTKECPKKIQSIVFESGQIISSKMNQVMSNFQERCTL